MKLRYRVILAGLLVATTSYAAEIRLEVVTAKSPVTFAVRLTPNADSITGVQFDLEYDTAALNVTVEVGPVAEAAGKQLQTAVLDASKQRVLLIGFNKNNMADGVVALLHVSAKAATATAYTIRLTAPAGTDGLGKTVTIAGTDVVLSVPALEERH